MSSSHRQAQRRSCTMTTHGNYLSKRIILEMYDQMVALPTMHVPAPKDESATYAVPDVSQWQTWLEPGPADERVAHSSQ